MKTIAALLLLAASAVAADVREKRDVPYAEPRNEKQTLDVFAPADGTNHPVVVWIHGGGWQHGDKKEMAAKPAWFVSQGFVFVTINYRLLPEATIKQMAQDVAKAVRWVHDHAGEFGGDPRRILVMGHSAGAQLAALVCTDDRYLKAEGLSLSIVKGCVPVDAATFDVPKQIAMVEERRAAIFRMKFGDAESQRDLSAVTHIAKGKAIPPFLVPCVAENPETRGQSELLVRLLRESGIEAKVLSMEGTTHVKLDADLGLPDDKPSRELLEFARGVVK
jgi:acetyl esterase/lipase